MILVDAGAWLALADRGDAHHIRCREYNRDFNAYRWKNQHPFRNLLIA